MLLVSATLNITSRSIPSPRAAQMLSPLDSVYLFFEVLADQAIELNFQAPYFYDVNFTAIAYFDTLISVAANILEIVGAGLTKDFSALSAMILPCQKPKLSCASMALLCNVARSPFCYLNINFSFTLIIFLAKCILNLARLTTSCVPRSQRQLQKWILSQRFQTGPGVFCGRI